MELQANTILQLAEWKMNQPSCKAWMDFNNIEEDRASRIVVQQLRSILFDLQAYTGDTQEQILSSMGIGPNNSNNSDRELLYGICDEYHMAHTRMIEWLDKINPMIINPNSLQKLPYGILDYYGKSGELAMRIAKGCKNKKLHISYIDQNPWYTYAKFRFKSHKLMYNISTIEATPANPRPELTEKFALISTLDLPLTVTEDWTNWLNDCLIPAGIVVTRTTLNRKLIDVAGPFKFYQNLPA